MFNILEIDSKIIGDIWFLFSLFAFRKVRLDNSNYGRNYFEKVVEEIKNIKGVNGIHVYQTSWILAGSGICLPGIGIFISSEIPESAKQQIIQHEFGHFLDFRYGVDGDQKRLFGSRLLGFYILIGIPSLFNLIPLINQIPNFKGDHRTFWTEIRANQLAKAHFGERLAEGFDRRFPSKYEV